MNRQKRKAHLHTVRHPSSGKDMPQLPFHDLPGTLPSAPFTNTKKQKNV